MVDADDTRAETAQPSPELARIVHRLGLAHGTLELAAAHWEIPHVLTEDMGAVALIQDVTHELDSLYAALADFGHEHKHLVDGPLVASFADGREPLANERSPQ